MNKLLSWLGARPWLLPIVSAVIMYCRLPLTYFEQDEWIFFGEHITGHRLNSSYLWFIPVQRAMTGVLLWLEWHIFHTHAAWYGLLSIALLIALVLVFYRVLLQWKIDHWQAALSAALIPLFAAGSHSITWYASFTASLPSYLTALIALSLWLTNLKEPRWWRTVTVAVLSLVALYFKEEALWLLPMIVISTLLYLLAFEKPKNNTLLVIGKTIIFQCLTVIAAFALFLGLERFRQIHNAAFSTLISSTDSAVYFTDIIKTVFMMPLLHLGQVIVSPDSLAHLEKTKHWSAAGLSYAILAMLIGLLVYRFVASRNRAHRLYLIWGLCWALVSFLAFGIFGKNPLYLEARYYFPAQAPIALLLVALVWDKSRETSLAWRLLVGGLVAVLMVVNVYQNWNRLSGSIAIGQERQRIVSAIQKSTGPLPAKAVIFAETSNTGYAGAPEPILPFQVGFGYMMEILYHNHNQDYRPFIQEQYLWGWLDQGYKEHGPVGFGYFRDYPTLDGAVTTSDIPISGIYAFRYEGATLADITSTIRTRLVTERLALRPLTKDGWSITSNHPEGVDVRHHIDKAIDADPKSDWSVAHQAGTYFQVDTGSVKDKIASIVLTTADGNSYPRRYKAEGSVDGKAWQVLSQDVARQEGAQTRITFSPQSLRYFRVTQTETKPVVFNWSLSDITLMQAP